MRLAPFLAATAVAASPLAAQRAAANVAVPSGNAPLRAALATIQRDNAWTVDQQQSICEIPAPPFKEAVRGVEFSRRIAALGLTNVRTDSEGNVIAERRGTGGGPTVVVSGHLDTVFPEGTNVKVKREGTLMMGPGIGDDCRGLAVLLSVARAYESAKVRTPGTVYFIATVGEEGPGNLRGVRHLFTKEMPGKVQYFISVDGTGLDVTTAAVGSHRYRVAFKGPGGHSFGAFGMPNPIHAMGRAIARIGDIQTPTSPKTTFNVGVVSGGTSVNSISAEGVMDVDLRSESQAALDSLDRQMRAAVDSAIAQENARWPKSNVRLTAEVRDTGKRPAGSQPDTARVVAVALAAGRALGFTPKPGASSTDANIPLSLGIPSITMDGGGRGEGAHSLGESYDDTARGYLGPQWVAMVVATLAGLR